MVADSIVSWFVLTVGGLGGVAYFFKLVLDSKPEPKKDYGKVKSVGYNLDWHF